MAHLVCRRELARHRRVCTRISYMFVWLLAQLGVTEDAGHSQCTLSVLYDVTTRGAPLVTRVTTLFTVQYAFPAFLGLPEA